MSNQSSVIAQQFLEELESEIVATRKCIERMKPELAEWKPHQKSMKMVSLAVMLAEIPKWITYIIQVGEINFATWEKYEFTTTKALLEYFDENITGTKKALANMTDEDLKGMFYLKSGEHELLKDSVKISISEALNHWVHHRGQYTVYLRLNDIPVPSIYGPSADDKNF